MRSTRPSGRSAGHAHESGLESLHEHCRDVDYRWCPCSRRTDRAEHQPRAPGRGGRRGVVRGCRHFRAGIRIGQQGAAELGCRARSDARPGNRPDRPADRGQHRSAGAADHDRDRQAVRRGPRRGARDRRHLRLFPGRGAAALRPDRAQRDDGQTVVHPPTAGRGGRGDYGRQLPGRRAGLYIVPPLVNGNTVVWKPAEYSAVISAALHELFVRGGGLPDGVFNLVHADGAATFAGLQQSLENGFLNKVGFTGSSAVGREIGALTGRHLQTACLELGGKNPLVITPSADLDLAVEGALFSGFGTAGQRCTSLGTVIVHESIHARFSAKFTDAVARAKVGDPTTDVLMGPLLDAKFADRFEEYLTWIQPHHMVYGATGRISAENPRDGFIGDPGAGLYYHPVVVDGVRSDDRIFAEATFGPIVGLASYGSFNQALELANAPGYGLSSAIYTSNPKEAFAFAGSVGAGMVSINNSTSGAEAHLPFGGNGKSGNGSRQSGMWVLDQFTRWQAVNWDYSGRLQRAQMDIVELTPDTAFRL